MGQASSVTEVVNIIVEMNDPSPGCNTEGERTLVGTNKCGLKKAVYAHENCDAPFNVQKLVDKISELTDRQKCATSKVLKVSINDSDALKDKLETICNKNANTAASTGNKMFTKDCSWIDKCSLTSEQKIRLKEAFKKSASLNVSAAGKCLVSLAQDIDYHDCTVNKFECDFNNLVSRLFGNNTLNGFLGGLYYGILGGLVLLITLAIIFLVLYKMNKIRKPASLSPKSPTQTSYQVQSYSTQQPDQPYGTQAYGTQQPVQPYGTQQPVQPYGIQQPVQPYGTQQPVQPYGTQQPVQSYGTQPYDTQQSQAYSMQQSNQPQQYYSYQHNTQYDPIQYSYAQTGPSMY